MPENLIDGLQRFRRETFPRYREHYRRLVEEGQRPTTLFIGCSDSRVVPDLLMSTGPGELFIVRNMGAFVPPFEEGRGFHGTSAAIEYAVTALQVTGIVLCGHTHCGAIQALYAPPNPDTPHVRQWLELGEEARLPGMTGTPASSAGPEVPPREVLLRTEKRSVALQLGRLLSYPMVRERVEAGTLALHAWLYVIEDGQVLALDVDRESFVPLTSG